MRVIELQQNFGLEALALAQRPDPLPGPGQVLLKMRAWSLNYRDLLVVKGQYNPKLRLPFIPLSDGVGEILTLGPGVTGLRPGDRVAGLFMPLWTSGPLTDAKAKSALGGGTEGLLSEYAVLPADGVIPVPQYLTDVEAACLPCAAVTAWNAVVTQGNVQAGQTVLIQGSGGVSLFALQFAKLHGARVIATSSSPEKMERLKRLGADETISYRAVPEWGELARGLTGGSGVDLVVEVGGAGTITQSLKAVRPGGTIAMIGVLGGAAQIPSLPLLMKNIRVQGVFVGSKDVFAALNQALNFHCLRPQVDRIFPMIELAAALKYLESGHHFGKVCLQLDDAKTW